MELEAAKFVDSQVVVDFDTAAVVDDEVAEDLEEEHSRKDAAVVIVDIPLPLAEVVGIALEAEIHLVAACWEMRQRLPLDDTRVGISFLSLDRWHPVAVGNNQLSISDRIKCYPESLFCYSRKEVA